MKIKTLPERSLFEKSEEVTEINAELQLAIREMADLLLEKGGLGLSAPQVGINKRFFIVMHPGWDSYKVFINPEILSVKGKIVLDEEGCLSIPGLVVNVPRYEKIKISYFELNGKEYIEEYKDILARIVQHECEHLDGKLITEYI
jgi:peptide deformylase